MEHFITIAVAILGSGAISTIIGLIAARSQPSRQADALEAWNTESQLLGKLEAQAGIVGNQANTSARDLALAIAARTQINAAIANRLIPKNNVSNTTLFVGGLLLVILGVAIIVASIVAAQYLPEIRMQVLAYALTVLGLVFLVVASLMIFIGYYSEAYRNVMRAQVQRILNNEPQLEANTHAEKYKWIAGQEPPFSKCHIIALPSDLRQSFRYFMINAKTRMSDRNLQLQT